MTLEWRNAGVPSRRAGQPDMAEGPVMPQGDVQERAGLIAELQKARADAACLKAEHKKLQRAYDARLQDEVHRRMQHPLATKSGYVLRHPGQATLIIGFDQDMMYLQIDTNLGSERVYLTRAEETQVVLAMIERRGR